jgi:FkbM family methyltransferase
MHAAVHSLYRRAIPAGIRRWLYSVRYFWGESAGITKLAPRGPARAWLATIRVFMCFKHELPLRLIRRAPIPVWVEPAGRVFVSDWSELLVVREIYQPPGDYNLTDLPERPHVIVDVGANIGLAARFFRNRYPTAKIVAYEPDPASFHMAQRNVRNLTHLSLRNIAVGASSKRLRLYRVAGESWGTSAFVPNQAVAETFEASAVTLDSIIEELGTIDILKIDIEGAEYEVLQACRQLDRINCIVGEFHPVPSVTPGRFFALLNAFDLLENNASHGKGTFLALRRPEHNADG